MSIRMDQIFLTDLRVHAVIGVYDWERTRTQELRISLTIFLDTRPAAAADDLAGSVDYARLADAVRAHAQSAGRFTLEALAEDIAAICLQEPGAQRVRVRIEKPGAVRSARTVGVEIERP